MVRISLAAFVALTLISNTAQASPYASSVKIALAPGYTAPGEPAPAAQPAPGEPAPAAQPQPYGQPQPQPQPYPYAQPQPYPYAQPYGYGPPPPPPPPEKPRRRGKGLMIAGWTVFGSSYLMSAVVGAAMYDSVGAYCDIEGSTCPNVRERGGLMFVPIIGPLLSIPAFEVSATGTMFGVVLFAAQSAGLAMGIAGTVIFVRDGKRMKAEQQQQTGLHLGRGVYLRPSPRLDGGSLNLSYRF